MKNLEIEKLIQENSPDGGFLQSEEWRKFQESVGRKTYCVTGENFYASVIKHCLPIVGSYFYIPRGPVMKNPKSEIPNLKQIQNSKSEIQNSLSNLIDLVKKNNIGWIRIEPASKKILEIIKNAVGADLVSAQKGQTQGLSLQNYKIQKAPHDMQPREIFVINITKSEEELLAEMKAKTRYNIKVAQKHGVVTRNMKHETCNKDINEFIRLVKITAQRDKITPHPESYYRKMFETISPGILKLYVAEYNNKIIAANIVIFYGNTATYLHGASDNEYRNVMAPYLLQWQAIQDAKKAGIKRYDLGGVRTYNMKHETCNKNSWSGITKFKTGFSTNTKPIKFPGSYDIIINPVKYYLYRILQKCKNIL